MKCDYYWPLAVILLLVGIGCNGPKKSSAMQDQKTAPERLVHLDKKGCRGYCPRYTVELYSDGMLKFTGRDHVAMVGDAERQLTEREMASVQSLLGTTSFHTLDELYDNGIVDVPFHTMEINYAGKRKMVKSRGDKPGAFQELEKLMEVLAQKESWLDKKNKAGAELTQLIVELDNPDLVSILEERYTDFDLQLNKRISPRQLYFLFDVKNTTWDRADILNTVKNDADVKSVQWNRQLNRRE